MLFLLHSSQLAFPRTSGRNGKTGCASSVAPDDRVHTGVTSPRPMAEMTNLTRKSAVLSLAQIASLWHNRQLGMQRFPFYHKQW
jgi:hypothetical protein